MVMEGMEIGEAENMRWVHLIKTLNRYPIPFKAQSPFEASCLRGPRASDFEIRFETKTSSFEQRCV